MVKILKFLTKSCFVLPEANKNVYLSARNIERANVAIVSALNTYNVLNAETFCCYRKLFLLSTISYLNLKGGLKNGNYY